MTGKALLLIVGIFLSLVIIGMIFISVYQKKIKVLRIEKQQLQAELTVMQANNSNQQNGGFFSGFNSPM